MADFDAVDRETGEIMEFRADTPVGEGEHAATLASLVRRAAMKLASAETAAEVLEARDSATIAYDAAKLAARLAKAKSAHDEVIAAVYRAQADALEIESLAKRRLADEYDAAQERGEVGQRTGRPKVVPNQNDFSPATAADIGLSRKDIYEARQIRDAEKADPGVVRRTLNGLLEAGEQPTKAAINRELVNRTSFTGNNEWYTPGEYLEAARDVLGTFDLDPASSDAAQEHVKADRYFTKETDGLDQEWLGRVWLNPPYAQPHIAAFVSKMVAERRAGRVKSAVMLTHNYTDTSWFHEAAAEADAICFTRGRVKFYDADGKIAAPTQGQAFFYFGEDVPGFASRFRDIGFVVEPFTGVIDDYSIQAVARRKQE